MDSLHFSVRRTDYLLQNDHDVARYDGIQRGRQRIFVRYFRTRRIRSGVFCIYRLGLAKSPGDSNWHSYMGWSHAIELGIYAHRGRARGNCGNSIENESQGEKKRKQTAMIITKGAGNRKLTGPGLGRGSRNKKEGPRSKFPNRLLYRTLAEIVPIRDCFAMSRFANGFRRTLPARRGASRFWRSLRNNLQSQSQHLTISLVRKRTKVCPTSNPEVMVSWVSLLLSYLLLPRRSKAASSLSFVSACKRETDFSFETILDEIRIRPMAQNSYTARQQQIVFFFPLHYGTSSAHVHVHNARTTYLLIVFLFAP